MPCSTATASAVVAGEVLRAASRRPLERHAGRVVQREQDAGTEALDLERAPQLAAERVERRRPAPRIEERHVDDDARARPRARRRRAPRVDPSAARRRSPAAGRGRRDRASPRSPTPSDERRGQRRRPVAMSATASRDECGRDEVEPREDDAAEEHRHDGDDAEDDQPVAAAAAEVPERPVEREHRERADEGELGDEGGAIGLERVGDERGKDERPGALRAGTRTRSRGTGRARRRRARRTSGRAGCR